jgi:pimeloyl-ACP methyl ester carboxylesterase
LRRAADLGQGWYGFNLNPARAAERIERLQRLLDARGRGASAFAISVTPPWSEPISRDRVAEFEALGVDQVIVTVLGFDIDGMRAQLDFYAELAR